MLKKDAHVPCASCSNFNAHSAQIYLTKHTASVAEWALSFESPKAVYESGVTGFHLCRALRALGLDCAVGAVSKMQRPAAGALAGYPLPDDSLAGRRFHPDDPRGREKTPL